MYALDNGKSGTADEKIKELFLQRDEARSERDRLDVNGIHSCHHKCGRPLCKLRRERDALLDGMREIVACAHNSMDALDEAEKMEAVAKSFLENAQGDARRTDA